MKTFTSHSLAETEQIAKDWLIDISNKYKSNKEALVVGLSGHLGAGKTAFVKAIAKILGVKEEVTSPTFVIMKIYEISVTSKQKTEGLAVPWKRLVHIDAYRLERREELDVLEWEKLVADKDNIILVEWLENVGLEKTSNCAFIWFEIDGKDRVIKY